eukprot:ANDGO_02726.mRNA.1 hypothetical protein
MNGAEVHVYWDLASCPASVKRPTHSTVHRFVKSPWIGSLLTFSKGFGRLTSIRILLPPVDPQSKSSGLGDIYDEFYDAIVRHPGFLQSALRTVRFVKVRQQLMTGSKKLFVPPQAQEVAQPSHAGKPHHIVLSAKPKYCVIVLSEDHIVLRTALSMSSGSNPLLLSYVFVSTSKVMEGNFFSSIDFSEIREVSFPKGNDKGSSSNAYSLMVRYSKPINVDPDPFPEPINVTAVVSTLIEMKNEVRGAIPFGDVLRRTMTKHGIERLEVGVKDKLVAVMVQRDLLFYEQLSRTCSLNVSHPQVIAAMFKLVPEFSPTVDPLAGIAALDPLRHALQERRPLCIPSVSFPHFPKVSARDFAEKFCRAMQRGTDSDVLLPTGHNFTPVQSGNRKLQLPLTASVTGSSFVPPRFSFEITNVGELLQLESTVLGLLISADSRNVEFCLRKVIVAAAACSTLLGTFLESEAFDVCFAIFGSQSPDLDRFHSAFSGIRILGFLTTMPSGFYSWNDGCSAINSALSIVFKTSIKFALKKRDLSLLPIPATPLAVTSQSRISAPAAPPAAGTAAVSSVFQSLDDDTAFRCAPASPVPATAPSLVSQSNLSSALASAAVKAFCWAPVRAPGASNHLPDPNYIHSSESQAPKDVVVANSLPRSEDSAPAIPSATTVSSPPSTSFTSTTDCSRAETTAGSGRSSTIPDVLSKYLSFYTTVEELGYIQEVQRIISSHNVRFPNKKTFIPHLLYFMCVLKETGYDQIMSSSDMSRYMNFKFNGNEYALRKMESAFAPFAERIKVVYESNDLNEALSWVGGKKPGASVTSIMITCQHVGKSKDFLKLQERNVVVESIRRSIPFRAIVPKRLLDLASRSEDPSGGAPLRPAPAKKPRLVTADAAATRMEESVVKGYHLVSVLLDRYSKQRTEPVLSDSNVQLRSEVSCILFLALVSVLQRKGAWNKAEVCSALAEKLPDVFEEVSIAQSRYQEIEPFLFAHDILTRDGMHVAASGNLMAFLLQSGELCSIASYVNLFPSVGALDVSAPEQLVEGLDREASSVELLQPDSVEYDVS